MSMAVTSQSGEFNKGNEYEPHGPNALHPQSIRWPMAVASMQVPPERQQGAVEQGPPYPQIRPRRFERLLPSLNAAQRRTADMNDQSGD
jgi:hypothetical protein